MKEKCCKRTWVNFIGNSSTGVTGSAYLVNHKQYQVLLDCGMIQGQGDIYSDYKANYEQARKFKPRLIDAILISHSNLDHFAMLPYLYSKGCKATIYVPEGCKKYISILLEDTLKIMQSDCLKIQKKRGRRASPLFEEGDICTTLSHMIEIPFNYEVHINEDIWFEFLQAGHIQHAASIFLTLKRGSILHKIYYTGDIGGPNKQMYVEERQTPKRFDLGILENTYNEPSRPNNSKDRANDLEKMADTVRDYTKTIIPCFAQNRSQVILTELYNLWKQDKIPKDIKVYFDAPLGIKLSNVWDGEEWEEVWNWENLIKVQDYSKSQEYQANKEEKCVVIAGAGMCNSGRVVSWLKNYLGDIHTHLLFVGYCPPYGIAHEIKSCSKYVTIEGVPIKNNCNYTELRSFSSHASYEELIDFYTTINGNKYCLVHGDYENKVAFSNVLQDKLIEKGKSTKVVCTNQDTKTYL